MLTRDENFKFLGCVSRSSGDHDSSVTSCHAQLNGHFAKPKAPLSAIG